MWATDFWMTLLITESFYRSVVWILVYLVPAVLILIFLTLILARRRRQRLLNLLLDDRGSATAIDFTITIPLYLFLLMVIVQLAILANGALIVHYSAYSAARSARVWMWDRDTFLIPEIKGIGLHTSLLRKNKSREVVNRVERAARTALIPASPVNAELATGGVNVPTSAIRQMAVSAGMSGRAAPLLNKARYAFNPNNSVVRFDYSKRLEHLQFLPEKSNAWAVRASVRYKLHIEMAPAAFLRDLTEKGHNFVWVEAEVTML
ncbi:MAG: hypothetical protein ACI909_002518 [Planctomycetota bacterium]|jgi:hypothetical protein